MEDSSLQHGHSVDENGNSPELDTQQPRAPKKRRIPKACASCRKSKVRCDEKRPCTRCVKSATECIYFERPKDLNSERFEKIEGELARLSQRLLSPARQTQASLSSGSIFDASLDTSISAEHSRTAYRSDGQIENLTDFTIRKCSGADLIATGLVSEVEAQTCFTAFFEGCDRFVPVFDSVHDGYASLRQRSSILFDIIVIYGARAANGVLSKAFQKLYGTLRQHTSDLVLRLSSPSDSSKAIEDIQALLVVASYSDSGAVLCDVALRAALDARLPARLDELFAVVLRQSTDNRSLFVSARVWYSIYVLDMILSLDGGKPPTVSIRSSPRRIRTLLRHPQRTSLDLRLFAQVELNAIRSSAHASLLNESFDPPNVINGALLDLDLWSSEWQTILFNDQSISSEHGIMSLNLQVQHAWAVLALQLRALSASGVENIALMTENQRDIALAAKAAAERHLKLILTEHVSNDGSHRERPYVNSFKYAMEFVWAKNAFCVLIVLRLGILLGDSPDHLIARLSEAQEFLHELDKIGMGANISYTRILAQTVRKCERAIHASLQSGSGRSSVDPNDTEFQSFIPKEFLFEWDFPGLNLCYIPFDWQDLFLDFGATAW